MSGGWATATRALRYASNVAASRGAIRELRRLSERARTLDERVDLAFDFDFLGLVDIRPLQKRPELLDLARRTAGLRPGAVLEVGTADGGTLYALAGAAAADARIVSLDLPWRGGYHPLRERLYRAFAGPRQAIRLIRADSHAAETVELVRRALDGRPVDVLLIDGDHRYEGVRRDYELYAGLVREGGLIAFHDIVTGPPEAVGGVPDFWRELKARSEGWEELVDDPGQGGCGIGLLRAPGPELV